VLVDSATSISRNTVRHVICLDDTPSVLHNLRVHPVDQPDTVALVGFDQLAIYDDEQ
jgi:hypothetical protein